MRATLAPESSLDDGAGGGRRRRLETTADKLRLLQIVLIVACVVCGAVAAGAVQLRIAATREIEERTEPLSADAVDVYRALADADAAVAQRFLQGDSPTLEARYATNITIAATSLTEAGTLSRRHSLTADRITDIAVQLPVYTGLVEGALRQVDRGAGVAKLKDASALMQSTILRRAESFQRTESQRLDAQYRQAGALPRLAVAAGATSLLALLGAQAVLTRRTRRLVNLGILAAGAVVVGLGSWWALALSTSDGHLADSRRHSQAVSDALGPGQIAARQARASEILGLVVDDAKAYREDYSARMQRLARADGAGGALGAAHRLISGPAGQTRIADTVADARAWLLIHRSIDDLHTAGKLRDAVDLAVGPAEASSAAIDRRLADAVEVERREFSADVRQAEDALAGLVPATIALMLVAAGAATLGIGQRLKEYR